MIIKGEIHMKIYLIVILVFLHLFCIAKGGEAAKIKKIASKGRIVIEMNMSEALMKRAAEVKYAIYQSAMRTTWQPVPFEKKGNNIKWSLQVNKPVLIGMMPVLGKNVYADLLEPGDSIYIEVKNNKPVYSGRGAVKFVMVQKMEDCENKIPLPANKVYNNTKSMEDYMQWSAYLDLLEENMDSVFLLHKDKVDATVYDYLKADKLLDIEYMRLMKFFNLLVLLQDGKVPGAGDILSHTFDTTTNNRYAQWLHAFPGKVGKPHYFYDFARRSAERKYNFNMGHPALEHLNRKLEYIAVAKNIYKNDIMQGFLAFLLTNNGVKEFPHSRMIDSLLADFYAQPEYPAYKEYVKEYEKERRSFFMNAGNKAGNFMLKDTNGNSVSLNTFDGKVVLMDFLNKDCEDCVQMSGALDTATYSFGGDTNLVRVTVIMDTDKVDIRNESSGKPQHFYLHADSPAELEYLRKHYCVVSHPAVFLLDHEKNLVYDGENNRFGENPLPDPRKDAGKVLTYALSKLLQFTKDGPYVMYSKEGVSSYTLKGKSVTEWRSDLRDNIHVTVATDAYNETFAVSLKKNNVIESSIFPQPEKMFVLSDIEGNFSAFKKLLIAGGIIDAKYNWIYGNGRLVFAGDMFDRGLQVTECLWLVYALEEKAKKGGGYVHFILGNHEIMNLQGDHRYVEDKYKENAKLMSKTLTQLYNEDSELGRWLRTKNIVEKIGNLFFAHGGISRELNQSTVTIEEINQLARPYYAENKKDYGNQQLNTIMSNTVGPFWYRGYYGKVPVENVVDSTLQKFNVKHIITGHTIIADTISTHYNRKVINTDTRHKAGKSEALLIEGRNFYRVNAEGKRVLLFREEEK
jgi:peroxiredoxin